MRGGWYSFEARYIKNIPIPVADRDQKSHIELLVNQVLASKKEDAGADTSALESEVDQLVYELYGLTEEEIAIVEEVGSDGIHNKDNEFKKIKY